jgi:hypothetical protein
MGAGVLCGLPGWWGLASLYLASGLASLQTRIEHGSPTIGETATAA